MKKLREFKEIIIDALLLIPRQVGFVLHYSSLSTMLWLGVTARNIYKQVTKKPPQNQVNAPPPSSKQTLLR